MKKYFLIIFTVVLSSSVLATEQKIESPPTISAETEVSKYVSATECYVLFLLEGTGETMQEAQKNFERKLTEFTQKTQKDFPQANRDVVSVNIGTRDFNNFRAAENPFAPNITKLLIFILPPDENMAITLLDSGLKAGLMPFCGEARDGTFGAVFYGLKNPEIEIDKLYPQTTKILISQGEKLAAQLQCEIVKMDDLTRFSPRESPYELRFKDIKASLPSEFCSSDKDKIKISLILRADFIVRKKKLLSQIL